MTFTSNNHGKLYGKSSGCLSDRASVWHTDFKHKGFALFNYNMNELGNHLPGRLETLPLEDFDVEDIPLCGERIVRKENITDIFFYDEKSNPYSDNRVDMKKLKAYNKYIYPLSLILNRNL